MDKLTHALQSQQAQLPDPDAFTDLVMNRIEAPSRTRLQLTLQRSLLWRAAASVVMLLAVGLFALISTPPALDPSTAVCSLCYMEKYQIGRSQLPSDGTPRDLYRCYMDEKREQTFYHNELIKHTHENL
ncbi:MAG: hypothetical protein J5641_00310 [Bacteroidales bacterium]|nr:hypothetical protein [Bacteroidales bacterium]